MTLLLPDDPAVRMLNTDAISEVDRAALVSVIEVREAVAARLSVSELNARWDKRREATGAALTDVGQIDSAIGDYRRACEGGDSTAVERTRSALLHRLDSIITAAKL